MRKLTKAEMVDGFDADIDEGDSGGGPRRVIQGGKVKFTNDFTWVDANEEEIPPDLELIVADRQRSGVPHASRSRRASLSRTSAGRTLRPSTMRRRAASGARASAARSAPGSALGSSTC